ncbi:MAG: hypothetical protein Q9207_003879 [Kuettlingeria erythrocarpa]
MGNSVARADDFECLDWNKNVPHITVTGSSGGFVTVWDVKTKKESLTLNNMGRKAVSAVAWDPKKHTRLVTAIPLDTDPVILVWDLRNANTPERVRSLSNEPQDVKLSLAATASFDGKISVHPLQSTQVDTHESSGVRAQSVDDVDFFNTPQPESRTSSFSLPRPPKWLQKPCGATFGFGGKVVSFNAGSSESHPGSKVRILTFTVDDGIGESTVTFEKAVQDKDLVGICKRQIFHELDDSAKADWKIIETLTSQNPRKELIKHLGFSAEEDEAADGIAMLTVNGDQSDGASSDAAKAVLTARHNRLSAFFESSTEGDNFLSDLAATKGAKINNPFQIYSGSESEPDRRITRALLLGEFDRALDICLQEDRLSDAFMVAVCGGQSCIEKAQKAYFNRKTGGPNYLRLLASVVGKNLWDIVYNADLANWGEVMATLCTYAPPEEFPDLCETLGDRLDEQARNSENSGTLRHDASFCYLAGSKLEKLVGIWISDLNERERTETQIGSTDSFFGIHARLLQRFIEKVTVFREAANFQDQDLQATSNWKLGLLYDKYAEYADLLASFGQLQIAERYLGLLPKQYPAAEAAKERIRQATRGPARQMTAAKQPPTTGRPANRNPATITSRDDQPGRARPLQTPYNPYTPAPEMPTQSHPQPIQAPYKPPGYNNNYQIEPNQTNRHVPGPSRAHDRNRNLGPPPRTINASPSIPPPSQASNMGNWNDMPENFFKPATSRRGTPGMPPPGPNLSYGYPTSAPPGMQPPGGQQKLNAPLPPPPKGPPRTSSPTTTAPLAQPYDRPSSATSAYSPQIPLNQTTATQVSPMMPRGSSPYNPPPLGVPPSSRYAPVVNSPREAHPPSASNRTAALPPNPYAPQPHLPNTVSRAPGERIDNSNMPSSNEPPPRSSRPSPAATGVGGSEGIQFQQERQMSPAPPSKHPAGDRSHIPVHSRPILELLSADMQRVKARAPANFHKQVIDTEKRLNILFDHLNNRDLLRDDTVSRMVELSHALQARDYEQAQGIHLDLLTNKTDQCGQWMVGTFTLRYAQRVTADSLASLQVGVKRLIAMSRSTP